MIISEREISMRSAREAKWVYDELGVDLDTLNCVMAKVTPPEINLPEWYKYHANNKKRFWIAGVVGEDSHVTLRYGLFPEVKRRHVDAVLEGWSLDELGKRELMVFDSPYPDEQYKCVVLAVESDALSEANARLCMLPGINTFKDYIAHITIAYIHEDFIDSAMVRIRSQLQSYRPKFIELSYGDIAE